MGLTSYRCINGPWYSPVRNLIGATSAQYQRLASQALGIIYSGSANGISSVTDGTSNTLLMHEYVFSRLNINDKNCWHWWCPGNTDTIGTAMYAPNVAFGGALGSSWRPDSLPQLREPGRDLRIQQPPGRREPSVRRRIGQVHQEHGLIVGPCPRHRAAHALTSTSYDHGRQAAPYPIYAYTGNLPVYQALSTRAGGEVISADAY